MSAKGKQPAKKRPGTPLSKAFNREKALWEAEVLENSLSSHPELKQTFVSGSGEIEINGLYGPKDVESLDYLNDLGFPGKFPFTRGIEPCGLRAREWSQYFYTGFGTGESANERLKTLVRAGITYRLPWTSPPKSVLIPIIQWRRGKWGKSGLP
jgi:hypothetical protein